MLSYMLVILSRLTQTSIFSSKRIHVLSELFEPAHSRLPFCHCSLTASLIRHLSLWTCVFQIMALAWLQSHLSCANPTTITSFSHPHASSKACWRTVSRAMLSGTWRRSVGHNQQPAATPVVASRGMTVCGVPSGTVVLEAQYDYNYRGADGRQVCIREGERFILLKKTNSDWWQVRRAVCLVCLWEFFKKRQHLHDLQLSIDKKGPKFWWDNSSFILFDFSYPVCGCMTQMKM